MRKILLFITCLLILGGCANSDNAVPDSGTTPSPAATAEPSYTSAAVTPVPISQELCDMTMLSEEEVESIKALWPLKEHATDTFGKLNYITVLDDGGDSLEVYFQFFLDSVSVDSFYIDVQDIITGDWSPNDDAYAVSDGIAEGVRTECCITEEGNSTGIFISFMLDKKGMAKSMVDKHWPDGIMQLPAEFIPESAIRSEVSVGFTTSIVERAWSIDFGEKYYEWFKQAMSGYEYFSCDDYQPGRSLTLKCKLGSIWAYVEINQAVKTLSVYYRTEVENYLH